MRVVLIALAWSSLLPSLALAQATAVIVGPTEAAAGDLIILDASGSNADSLVWVLADSGKAILPVEGGRKCVFASGANGRYSFVLATAKQGDTAASVAIARHVITIGGTPKPDPNPGPTPDPPKPTPPTPLTGIARQSYDAAMSVDRRPGEAASIASEFLRIAASANAASPDLVAIAAECKRINLFQSAEAKARWANFNAVFGSVMRASEATVLDALRQLATGLSAAEASTGATSATTSDAANDTIRGMLDGLRRDLHGIQQEVGR